MIKETALITGEEIWVLKHHENDISLYCNGRLVYSSNKSMKWYDKYYHLFMMLLNLGSLVAILAFITWIMSL